MTLVTNTLAYVTSLAFGVLAAMPVAYSLCSGLISSWAREVAESDVLGTAVCGEFVQLATNTYT